MSRFSLALALCCTVFCAAVAVRGARAADPLAACLDPSTKIEAGGDVSDKELAAAEAACAHLKQTTQDDKTLKRIDAAAANLATEAKRRQAKH
jgi:hypothetical protein